MTSVRSWPFDDRQRAAVLDAARVVAITGGPGSGRTHALLARGWRVLDGGAPGSAVQVLVVDRRAAERAREALSSVGGCRVDAAPDFCARLLRSVEGAGVTLLPDAEAAGLLAGFMGSSWPEEGWMAGEAAGRPLDGDERAMRELLLGGGESRAWERYREECGRRRMYDRWRVVERAADLLEGNPGVAEALRNGPCRWLLCDDAHFWGADEIRLLDALAGDLTRLTVAYDPDQRWGVGHGALDWLSGRWPREVSVHRLDLCHRSSGAICRFLAGLAGDGVGGYRPEGAPVLRATGRTPGESEALAAEAVAGWLADGLDGGDVAVIDLWGEGRPGGMPLQLARVGADPAPSGRWIDEPGDAADAAAMLRLAVNRRDVSALSESWRRGAAGPRRIERRLVALVTGESRATNDDLVAAATSLMLAGALGSVGAAWMGDLVECQEALAKCLGEGGGLADVLDWRRRRVFDLWGAGSDRFWLLERAAREIEVGGLSGERLMVMLDGWREASAGSGGVEVVGVEGARGREWRGVCVINAVVPRDETDRQRRSRELYVACSRARDRLAVCDYRLDYQRIPAEPLVVDAETVPLI